MSSENQNLIERQPVVAIMGHVDHGKSSLLDAIRNSNVVEGEAGGITQHISAYEISHKTKEGDKIKKITFLDTPGHEAFCGMRDSGIKLADIVVLVVAADDGVMPQTKEIHKAIIEKKIPYIIAISKVDKAGVDIQKAKNSLIENGIYLEGMGGDISYVEIDSKSGKGLEELIETILLTAELIELKYDKSKNAEGFVLESMKNGKQGIYATLIIKDGTLPSSGSILAGTSMAPIRIVEDFTGKPIKNPYAGIAIKVSAFESIPPVGEKFISSNNKDELEKIFDERKNNTEKKILDPKIFRNAKLVIPVVLKADSLGTFNAVEREIKKVETDKKTDKETGIKIKIIGGGVGNITERDVLGASHDENAIILGFNVKIENAAKEQAERFKQTPITFKIIYELGEWFKKTVEERLPYEEIQKQIGKLKILKTFSINKDKQVVGGKVISASIKQGYRIKIWRRDFEIGFGKITEIQSMKINIKEVMEGQECGILIESKTEIIPGDIIEAFEIEKRRII